MLAPATEDMCKHGMRLGQVGVELHGLACQVIGPIEGGRIQIVVI
jgi:hypothetical protein